MAAPPLITGATKVTEAVALPAVAKTDVGASGAIAFDVYVNAAGFVREPLFAGVKVMLPATVGVIVKLWAAAEFEKVSTLAEMPALPAPVGVTVIVPVYALFGVTVKFPEALLTLPAVGPAKVKAVATGASGVTALEAAEAADVPAEFAALTVKVYEVPLVRPVMVWVREVDAALISVPPAGIEVTV